MQLKADYLGVTLAECYPPVLSIGAPAKCGHPKHPLMLAYATPLIPWSQP